MVNVSIGESFRRTFSRLKDRRTRERVQKQIVKLTQNPTAGKPMSHDRKGTRELYVKPFRLSYMYVLSQDLVVVLDLYHRKKQ